MYDGIYIFLFIAMQTTQQQQLQQNEQTIDQMIEEAVNEHVPNIPPISSNDQHPYDMHFPSSSNNYIQTPFY